MKYHFLLNHIERQTGKNVNDLIWDFWGENEICEERNGQSFIPIPEIGRGLVKFRKLIQVTFGHCPFDWSLLDQGDHHDQILLVRNTSRETTTFGCKIPTKYCPIKWTCFIAGGQHDGGYFWGHYLKEMLQKCPIPQLCNKSVMAYKSRNVSLR